MPGREAGRRPSRCSCAYAGGNVSILLEACIAALKIGEEHAAHDPIEDKAH